MSVLAIAGQYFIVRAQGRNAAHTNRFLTNIQVHKAADFSARVFFRTLFFKATQQRHLIVHLE